MRVVMVGKGSAGSWLMRGEQLGREIGADIYPHVTGDYDVAVVVKRAAPAMLSIAQRLARRVFWDIIDPWPQPPGNTWNRAEAMSWLATYIAGAPGVPIIAATDAMRRDIESLGRKSFFVPHHGPEHVKPNPIRELVQSVGYSGSPNYIRRWSKWVDKECRRRGWRFVCTENLADVDIALGLRDDAGYPARAWKSCVKLSVARAHGTPFIGSPEQGYLEQAVDGCEKFVETQAQLSLAFDELESLDVRRRISQTMLENVCTLRQCADTLREILNGNET